MDHHVSNSEALYPSDTTMSLRAFLLAFHDKYCRPGFIPFMQVFAVAAWILGAVSAIYAHAAGQ